MDVCRWERREGGVELELSKSESELALVPYGLRHQYTAQLPHTSTGILHTNASVSITCQKYTVLSVDKIHSASNSTWNTS